ncbi:hypothetical protein VPH35_074239 [Triticum aestivum]
MEGRGCGGRPGRGEGAAEGGRSERGRHGYGRGRRRRGGHRVPAAVHHHGPRRPVPARAAARRRSVLRAQRAGQGDLHPRRGQRNKLPGNTARRRVQLGAGQHPVHPELPQRHQRASPDLRHLHQQRHQLRRPIAPQVRSILERQQSTERI